ncbi:UNVERIFIED_CONTAM: hypothetical protein Sradi_0875300 [Sesamum radiatum]|uniref:Uncharacterized protein n=1 Tax=Sesamum radiatum TaxID=300843 RepID=A0AAW2V439_SESRA
MTNKAETILTAKTEREERTTPCKKPEGKSSVSAELKESCASAAHPAAVSR